MSVSLHSHCLVSFSWAFFNAFRSSELVAKDKCTVGGILAEDVLIIESFEPILLNSSKTDWLSKGKKIILNAYGGPLSPGVLRSQAFLSFSEFSGSC